MADIHVRTLGEDEWMLYREVRLAALRDAPEAFVARVEEEASYGEDVWRERMTCARRIIAERGGKPVGVVSLGLHDENTEAGEVFGLWTAPTVRGEHVARDLVATAADQAADDDLTELYFWVGSDNAAAIGFAANVGFRPSSERRTVRATDATKPRADEVAMVLPLADDPTATKNPYIH